MFSKEVRGLLGVLLLWFSRTTGPLERFNFDDFSTAKPHGLDRPFGHDDWLASIMDPDMMIGQGWLTGRSRLPFVFS